MMIIKLSCNIKKITWIMWRRNYSLTRTIHFSSYDMYMDVYLNYLHYRMLDVSLGYSNESLVGQIIRSS